MFIAGGVESMSRAPWIMSKAESAYARDQQIQDSTIGWRFPNPRFYAEFGSETMPETADNIAKDLGISREDSDVFAAASQKKYADAKADGFYNEEILPIEAPGASRRAAPVTVSEDEHPRADTSLEKLSSLRALYPDGVVTAGNASGINDGAVALLVGNREYGEKLGLKPRARVLAGAIAGLEPRVMGLGPVPAHLRPRPPRRPAEELHRKRPPAHGRRIAHRPRGGGHPGEVHRGRRGGEAPRRRAGTRRVRRPRPARQLPG